MSDDFSQASEILPGRFYFTCIKRPDSLRTSHIAATSICYSIDDELLFEPFFSDFGPLNLGKAYRFCQKTIALLQEADKTKKRLFYYCGPHAHFKANAAVLVGMYQVIYLNRTADDAYKPLLPFKPFVPFRDASCGVSSFHLTVLDCLKGIQKARDVGFIDWNSGNSTWSIEEYTHYEQVENGDLNWIMPGKLLAFSGPASRSNEVPGYRLHTPEDYWDYFRRKGVTAVVRLNKKIYDRRRFTDGGLRHYDLYFPDGTCPNEATLLKWLEIAESEPGGLAVHCKAGLGRTGILICAYLMKHFRFTAEEVIGYIRICRPGSVIGPQQNFMCDIQARMWHEGDVYRAQKGQRGNLGVGALDMAINGRPAISEPHMDNVASPYRGSAAAAVSANTQYGGRPVRADSAPSTVSASDLSLSQYKTFNSGNTMNSNAGVYGSTQSSAFGGASRGASNSNASGSRNVGYAGRSITPLRYGGVASNNMYAPSILTVSNGSSNGSTPPTSPTSPGQRSSAGNVSSLTKSMIAMRAPSVDRGAERISSLRATMHTDTLRAADRPRAILDRNFNQSADIGNSMGLSGIVGNSRVSGAGSALSVGSVGSQGKSAPIARTLAPNGQPRKVPVSILPQFHAGMIAAQRPGASSQSVIGSSVSTDAARLKSVAQLRYGLQSK